METQETGFRLPVVGKLAAGPFFDGFETGSLTQTADLDWVDVPRKLYGVNRFVVRVDGDSMEPLFKIGDLLVFEYTRQPRRDGEIVIAADFSDGQQAYAVKRYVADPQEWRFVSENRMYAPIRIPKYAMPDYPILGIFVDKVR